MKVAITKGQFAGNIGEVVQKVRTKLMIKIDWPDGIGRGPLVVAEKHCEIINANKPK